MTHQDDPIRRQRRNAAWSWTLAIFAGLTLGANTALAQEDAEAASEDDEALELRDVRVTGSRLNRPPSELSGNLIVLDREDIRASGELTLARVLRQLPQNVNATNETYGSRLNTGENRTGASTVNLRGLGSESTLILVDGRRVGYSGILGGVTDISTIPLSMVERIEILLDGASAVYGSDAVGGVVNIITRKDYSGLELDLNYGRPHKSGFDEGRAVISAGWAWDGGRLNANYEHFRHSGLDSSQRDSITSSNRSTIQTTRQKNTASGPQIRVWTRFVDESCSAADAILWEVDGRLLTRAEHAALDPAAQAGAKCVNDFTLPLGFQHTDDLQTIDLFGEPHWGDEAEIGVSLLPEQSRDVVNVGVDQDITSTVTLHTSVRYAKRDTNSQIGLNQMGGTLHAGNPFNPFGTRVSLSGLAMGTEPRKFESEGDELFARLGAEGSLGGWNWQAEFSTSRQEIDSVQLNVRDPAYSSGINSDGVSETSIGRFFGIDEAGCAAKQAEIGGTRYSYSAFFGGQCTVYGSPPDPINPFGDLNQYIIADVNAGSKNEQTQFEALARGNLFNAPGGPVALVVGYDYRQDVLDSFSELSTGFFLGSGTPTGSSPFSTRVSRDNNAAFVEGLIPLIGADNAMAGLQRLNVTFSARYDSYSNVEVDYNVSESGAAGSLEAADPGSELTYSGGLVYRPNDSMLFKADQSTSFVAPQLNQLLSRVVQSPSFLWRYVEGGGIGQILNVVRFRGGNDRLIPETADTLGASGEFSPAFLPGVFLKAAWSDTDFKDRIIKLAVPIVDLDDLPSNVSYSQAEDLYIVDDRWINSYSVRRSGVDLEMRYEWQQGMNDYAIKIRRGYTNRYDVQQSAKAEFVHDLVGQRDDTTAEDTVIPAVPKHQTSMQFTWMRGGLFFSLDVQGASETRRISGNRGVASYYYIIEPATHYDMVIGYEFEADTLFDAPAWMNGLDATLTVNNLTDAFSSSSRVEAETGDRTEYLVSPYFEWTQGRSYRLNIHKSF